MFSRRHPESSAKDVPCFKSCAVWIILLFIGPLMFFIIYSNSIINNEMNRIDNDVMLDKMSFRRTKRAILMPSVRKIRRPRHKLFNSTKSEDPSKKLPSVIIIGVKKGGTRALLTFLRLHPDIRAVGPETHFFDKYYHRGFEWYKNLMPPTVEGQITMEKTPSYFVTKEVPKRIYSMSPTMKLLVVVRDPVTRAVSDYAQTISKRASKPFEKLAFYNHTVGPVDANWSAIKIGLYSKHLSRWLQYFPMNQIHFVSGENLIRSPTEEMRKVQNFLNLQPIITERHFYFNKTKGFPCLKKSRSGGRPKCLGKTKGRVHPKIDAALLNRLKSFYKPFNLKFYKMTGIDFGWNK